MENKENRIRARIVAEIDGYLDEFCTTFGEDKGAVLAERFWVLTPDSKNPYKQLYTYN